MATWTERLAALLGGKAATPKPAPAARTRGGKPDIKNSARAKLIAEAVALHKIHSAPIRAIIANAARTLEKDTARALRNPEELSRLLAIVEAGRTFDRLMSGGLKSYLVLTGVREGLSQGKTLPPRPRPKP